MLIDITTQEIIDEHNHTDITHNGKVYIEIQQDIYGLTQSGRIAH